MLPEQNNLFNDLTFEMFTLVTEQIMKSFIFEIDRVELIYNQFKNARCKILQMKYSFLVEAVPSGKVKANPVDYIYEPD